MTTAYLTIDGYPLPVRAEAGRILIAGWDVARKPRPTETEAAAYRAVRRWLADGGVKAGGAR